MERDTCLWLLKHHGMLINWEKSILVPCQNLEYLGFAFSTVSVPGENGEDTVSAEHLFARGAKFGCGLRVPGLSRLEQLATPTENVPDIKAQMGQFCSRSV